MTDVMAETVPTSSCSGPPPVTGQFYCSDCKINLNSAKQLSEHLTSRKHREAQQAGGVRSAKVAGGLQLHRCDMCGVNVNSASQLALHLKSKRHLATMLESRSSSNPEQAPRPMASARKQGMASARKQGMHAQVQAPTPGSGRPVPVPQSGQFWKDAFDCDGDWTAENAGVVQQPGGDYVDNSAGMVWIMHGRSIDGLERYV